jgi:hypothetical protein
MNLLGIAIDEGNTIQMTGRASSFLGLLSSFVPIKANARRTLSKGN